MFLKIGDSLREWSCFCLQAAAAKVTKLSAKTQAAAFITQQPTLHSPKGNLYKNHSLPHK
jgi:hypothetical protein